MYEDLVIDLENDYLKGNDYFPSTVNEAYQLMANFSKKKGLGANQSHRRNNGVGFLQATSTSFLQKTAEQKPVPGVDGILHKDVQCWNCKAFGHYSNQCPKKVGVNLLQNAPAKSPSISAVAHNPDVQEDEFLGFGFLQVSLSQIQGQNNPARNLHDLNENWVLLDSQSNCDIFRNARLLSNVRKEQGPGLTLHTNGGTLCTNMVGNVKGYGTVWYDANSLANILSLSNVRKRFRITMAIGPQDPHPKITVHKPNGDRMVFYEHAMGLFVHDPVTNSCVVSKDTVNPISVYSFVNTVHDLESEFTRKQLARARLARDLYRRLGFPALSKFHDMLHKNQIKHCDVTLEDAKIANYVYGVEPSTIKGKSTRVTPAPVRPASIFPLPDYVKQFHSHVTVCVDVMFLNGSIFLTTVSEGFIFRTVEEISGRAYKHLLSGIQNVINVYEARLLSVVHVKADSEFECVRESILPCVLHVCAQSEHVPAIERSIRTLKDHARTIIHSLPYEYYPPLMIRYLMYFVTRLLNSMPAPNGISASVSPLSLVTGAPMLDANEFKIEFGGYAQVHDNPHITNTTVARSTGAIALCPANHHGGWYFLSLNTGGRLLRYSWTICTLTSDIISRVHDLASDRHVSTNDLLDLFTVVNASGALVSSNSESTTNNVAHPQAEPVQDDLQANEEPANDEIANEVEAVITDDEGSIETGGGIETNTPNKEVEKTTATELFGIDLEQDGIEENNKNRSENPGELDHDQARSQELANKDEESRSELLDKDEESRSVLQYPNERSRSDKLPGDTNSSVRDPEPFQMTKTETINIESNETSKDADTKNRFEDAKQTMENLVHKYNLRRNIKKAKNELFNKQHFNYLMYNDKSRSRKRFIKQIKHRQAKNELLEAMSRYNGQFPNKGLLHRNLVGWSFTQMSASRGI